MESRREQISVGIFVLIAAALLIFIVFALTGAFAGSDTVYNAKFNNAAGLEPGASVHYAGGPKSGHIVKIRIDPDDPTLIDLTFTVTKGLPVKTDSKVAIMSFSPLGDNHLEIMPGTRSAAIAPSGAQLESQPYVGFNDLTAQINKMAPQAQELIANLNARVVQLKTTIDRVDDLLNDQNRANVSGSLAQVHGMLKENRPQIQSTLNNVNAASAKIGPLLDQIHKTVDQANEAIKEANVALKQADETIKNVDGVVTQNTEGIHDSIAKLRVVLANVTQLTDQLNQMLDSNSDNIDQLLLNLRDVSDNLRDFTDEIKTQPSSLIHSSAPRDRKPGDKQ
jgi:phospholipid/cholesterol/gamma-HCH transport system substrate-binding protein